MTRALCPACRQPMAAERYPGHYGRKVELDVCHACNALWFDKLENLGLTAGGVLELLQSMHARHQERLLILPSLLRCPRCDGDLRSSRRRTHAIEYTVHDCPQGHGHFITFFELLREKDCVRPLRGEKLKALRNQVQSVSCSNCGAPVDLHKTAACTHCGAALALLDPDAMADTLSRLQAEHTRKTNPDGDQVAVDMALDRLRTERTFRQHERIDRDYPGRNPEWDLLRYALGAIMRVLSP